MAIGESPRPVDPTRKFCALLVLAWVVLTPGVALGAPEGSVSGLPSVASGTWMPAFVDGHGTRIVNPYDSAGVSPSGGFDAAMATGRVFVWNLDTAAPERLRPAVRRPARRHRVGA
jgi:hypothetical protein